MRCVIGLEIKKKKKKFFFFEGESIYTKILGQFFAPSSFYLPGDVREDSGINVGVFVYRLMLRFQTGERGTFQGSSRLEMVF